MPRIICDLTPTNAPSIGSRLLPVLQGLGFRVFVTIVGPRVFMKYCRHQPLWYHACVFVLIRVFVHLYVAFVFILVLLFFFCFFICFSFVFSFVLLLHLPPLLCFAAFLSFFWVFLCHFLISFFLFCFLNFFFFYIILFFFSSF